jgi:hypothetical protein
MKKQIKKVKYPRVDGKEFDHLRKAKFDELRESFAWVAKEEISSRDDQDFFSEEQIQKMAEVIGWNCAFMVVTNE